MTIGSSTRGPGSADWLINACKQNPEGLLLLGAGCALLFRKGASRSSRQSSRRSPGYAHTEVAYGSSGAQKREMPESAFQAAENARRYAADLGETVTDTAKSYASAAGEYAQQAGQTITDHSGRIARQAQSTMERIAREQPLLIALGGLAAGAALAAAFPLTRMERERLGPAGRRLSEAASDAREKLSEAAASAGERLMNIAEERGISAEGLKDVGRDVAGTFEKSFTEGTGNERAGGNKDARSTSSGTAQAGAAWTGSGAGSAAPGMGSATRVAPRSEPKPGVK